MIDNPIKVLAIDGGGIRGIIPARILVEMERRAGRPIAAMFDLIAGTSTGAILALGLTKLGPDGKPANKAEDILKLYTEQGPNIFPQIEPGWKTRIFGSPNAFKKPIFWPVGGPAPIGAEGTGMRYYSTGLTDALKQYLGDTPLSSALTRVLITSYEMESRTPFLFSSDAARSNPNEEFLMREVARATSAAPTYFVPAHIQRKDGRWLTLVDGGVCANNPAMLGYLEALRLARSSGRPDADILVVSLGTGEARHPFTYDEAKTWNAGQWGVNMLSIMFSGQSTLTDGQLNSLLNNEAAQSRYWRFQAPLAGCSEAMDDARKENIAALEQFATNLMESRKGEFEEVIDQLAASDSGSMPALIG